MSDDAPANIGPYLPERLLGRGAMAEVYLCRAPGGAAVAVKWLATQHPPLLQRFEREIAALKRLQHPGVVAYVDDGLHQERRFLVMEYVDGQDLRLYAKRLQTRPLAERYARGRIIGRALAEALAYLHDNGLVHRDVKPSNVLVSDDGRVVLTDLGVVKDRAETAATAIGVMVGTVAYAAPEQIAGDRVDGRTDLFGLGATLYFLVTLRRPFDGRDRYPDSRPPPPSRFDPSLPVDFEAIILRLMECEPAARYPDAAAVVQALTAGRVDGVAVAGRQRALEAVVQALDQVEAGTSLVLRTAGPLGVGKAWLAGVARQAARRRGIAVVESRERDAVPESRPVLFLASGDESSPPDVPEVVIELAPISLADVRRTVVGAAPMTPDSAEVATTLHRWTGGIPALLVPLIGRYAEAGCLKLPAQPDTPAVVQDYLDGLDVDEMDVLSALAVSRDPLAADELERVLHIPPEGPLEMLVGRGLVRAVGQRFTVGAELFRAEVMPFVSDPDGLAEKLEDERAKSRGALGDGSPEERARRVLDSARVDSLCGETGSSIDRLMWATSYFHATQQTELECRALCELGLVLLDVGFFGRARRRMADASALSRAGGFESQRRLAHVLRAAADLGERPHHRVAAASAINRLMPVLSGASTRRGDMADAIGFAVWARGAATLGDRATWRRSLIEATQRCDDLALADRYRIVLAVARACAAGGDEAEARSHLRRASACRSRFPLVAWHAERLERALDGADPSGVSTCLAADADEMTTAMRNYPEYVPRSGTTCDD